MNLILFINPNRKNDNKTRNNNIELSIAEIIPKGLLISQIKGLNSPEIIDIGAL